MYRAAALAGALFGGAASELLTLYVGSGGCDGEDTGCQDDPQAEQRVSIFEVDTSTFSVKPQAEMSAGDLPVWFASVANAGGEDGKQCVYATLPNKDQVSLLGASAAIGSHGAAPVYAQATPCGRVLLVANYHGPDDANTSTGAGVASFSIKSNCSLEFKDSLPHAGHSVNPARQGGAHVHSFVPIGHHLAFACDLGTDEIFTYGVNPDASIWERSRVKVAAGSGPRHIAHHWGAPFLHAVTEMGMTVLSFRIGENGTLSQVGEEGLVRDGRPEGMKAAEIVMHPSGEYLLATNRGKERSTVTRFAIDKDTGKLSLAGQIQTVAYPRGMALLSDKLFVVGGQSHSELVFYTLPEMKAVAKVTEGVPPHPAAFAVVPQPSIVNLVY